MSKTDQTTEIATKQDALRVTSRTITVGELEQALLELFPASDAESWDRTGLLVGDPRAVISGVAVALDATPRAVRAAQHIGANVLVTHHPAFLALCQHRRAPGVRQRRYGKRLMRELRL